MESWARKDANRRNDSARRANMAPKLEVDVYPGVTVGLESVFAASHLPLMCLLSNRFKSDLEMAIPGQPKDWPFEDRLLSVLLPTLRHDISRFHRGRGGDIATALPEEVLPRLDEHLTHQVNTLLFHLWKHPRSKWRSTAREFIRTRGGEAITPTPTPKEVDHTSSEMAIHERGDELVLEAVGMGRASFTPQRSESILVVVEAVINHQRPFLTHGIGALRPLAMRQIADTTGLHESTVSRIAATVRIRTQLGVFQLRDLFATAVNTETGGMVSSLTAKTILAEIIANEDIASPHTDLKLVDAMKKKGILLARRTVAKYRGVLGIPSAKQRRRSSE